jgi:hypothetical protein
VKPGYVIRLASTRDLPAFIAFAERFRGRLRTYPDCPIDIESVVKTFGRCVSSALCFATVVIRVEDGAVVGALLAVTQELWWSRSKEATDVVFHVEEEVAGAGRRLINQYVRWAVTIARVKVITIANSSGEEIDRVAKLFDKEGLERIGSLHQMQVVSRAVAA